MIEDYVRRGKIIAVVDGDTVDVMFDLGFEIFYAKRVRVIGIDAPDKNPEAKDAATAFLRSVLPMGSPVMVRTTKTKRDYDKYNRYLADIATDTVPSVSALMVESGYAVPYEGGKRN